MDPLLSKVSSRPGMPKSTASYGATQWSSKASSLNNPVREKTPHTVHDITGCSQISDEEDYKPKKSQISKAKASTATAILDVPHQESREVDEGHYEKRPTPVHPIEYLVPQTHVCTFKKSSRREGDIDQGKFGRLEMLCRETSAHPASISFRVVHAVWCLAGIVLGVALSHECPRDRALPLCLIVGDSAWLVLAVIHLCFHRYENSLFLQFGSALLSAFLCVWYSLVFYWIIAAMTTPCKDGLLWVALTDAILSLLCLLSMALLIFVVFRQSEESERRLKESSVGTRMSKENTSAEETNKSRSVDPKSPAPAKEERKAALEKRSSGEHDRRKEADLPLDKTGPSTEGSQENPKPKAKSSECPQSTQPMTTTFESKERTKGSLEKQKTKSVEKSAEGKKKSGEQPSKETVKSTELWKN